MEIQTLLKALRSKVRFASVRGPLDIEQLFDLPLTARDDFSLDNIARNVHNELEKAGATSFVNTKANPKKVELQVKMDVVLAVIKIKEAEYEANRDRVAKDAKREVLKQALANAQNSALANLTPEEIQAQIDALN